MWCHLGEFRIPVTGGNMEVGVGRLTSLEAISVEFLVPGIEGI